MCYGTLIFFSRYKLNTPTTSSLAWERIRAFTGVVAVQGPSAGISQFALAEGPAIEFFFLTQNRLRSYLVYHKINFF